MTPNLALSSDGGHVVFFARRELRRVATAWGLRASSCVRAPAGNAGSWGQDDAIFHNRWLGEDAGLWMVPARGGNARLLAPAPVDRENVTDLSRDLLKCGSH